MRLRQHVNPLRLQYLVSRAGRLELPADRELEVELGCADAQFLFGRAAADPRVLGIGLEIRAELAHAVNARARAEGASVRAIFCNANVDFANLFAPASLARVFVNF